MVNYQLPLRLLFDHLFQMFLHLNQCDNGKWASAIVEGRMVDGIVAINITIQCRLWFLF